MVNADLIFGGIEGGATHSNIILVDGRGNVLASVEGLATNHWLVGIEECVHRIKTLVEDAKAAAGLSPDVVLDGLGLCLSGCEQASTNAQLESELRGRYPDLADTIFVASDTVGSLSTACRNGGVIIISGTGSNSLLLNPDGGTHQSGGWGHMIGDEGGAFWIASRAVKVLFDSEDNIVEAPHSTALLRKIIFEHFQLTDRFGILPHCYSNFEKHRFASLAAKVSKAAANGDKMCIQLMTEAGFHLGRYVSSLSRNMDESLFQQSRGLEIVCSGSVFKSWALLKPGFLDGITPRNSLDVHIPRYTLLRLDVTSAFGAIYQATKKHGYDLPRDYEKNSVSLFSCGIEPVRSNSCLNNSLIRDFNNGLTNGLTNGFNSSYHSSSFTNGFGNGHVFGHMGDEVFRNGRCRHSSGSLLKGGIKNSLLTSSLNSLHIVTHCV